MNSAPLGIDKPVRIAVGYMLWVMKNRRRIPRQLKRPFNHIKHGNYHDFIQEMKETTGQIVVYKAGEVSLHEESFADDFSFLGMLKSNASLKKFYDECRAEFGRYSESDLKDSTFEHLVIFELGIRMHAEKDSFSTVGEELQPIISRVSKSKGMTKDELALLHRGNEFLNLVKHPNDEALHKKFESWLKAEKIFEEVFQINLKYQLTII